MVYVGLHRSILLVAVVFKTGTTISKEPFNIQVFPINVVSIMVCNFYNTAVTYGPPTPYVSIYQVINL